jgi:dihydrodipicolinate synthase/N-acetylneuraminate lyase
MGAHGSISATQRDVAHAARMLRDVFARGDAECGRESGKRLIRLQPAAFDGSRDVR